MDPEATENPFRDFRCAKCGAKALRLEWRLKAKPIGTFSLSGNTMKVSAIKWPWCVCDSCGAESEGKL